MDYQSLPVGGTVTVALVCAHQSSRQLLPIGGSFTIAEMFFTIDDSFTITGCPTHQQQLHHHWLPFPSTAASPSLAALPINGSFTITGCPTRRRQLHHHWLPYPSAAALSSQRYFSPSTAAFPSLAALPVGGSFTITGCPNRRRLHRPGAGSRLSRSLSQRQMTPLPIVIRSGFSSAGQGHDVDDAAVHRLSTVLL